MEQEHCWLKSTCKGQCSSLCPKFYKLNFLYDSALLSATQRKHLPLYIDDDNSDLDAFKQLSAIEKNILDFVNNGRNLYIYSSKSGNGKSSWGYRLMQSYFNHIWHKCELSCRGLYIHVPRLLLSLKDDISKASAYVQHIKENFLAADLVIWDEIGVKALTAFEHEHLLNFINARLDYGKANIYTSNMQGEELQALIGDRLYSRIVNNSINIEFKGMDKRSLK